MCHAPLKKTRTIQILWKRLNLWTGLQPQVFYQESIKLQLFFHDCGIICCHDNKMYAETEGSHTLSLFFKEESVPLPAATGRWFTTAYSHYSCTGPLSPCRLNVEQHHDWDATSIHSSPLQHFWLTVQHTLFNPQERASRRSWKPVFLVLPLKSSWAPINWWYFWNISDCSQCNFIVFIG